MTEDQIRTARLRSFWLSVVVAILPYLLGVVWRFSDDLEPKVVFLGVPDLAIGGVVVAIAAFSNTIFSFTKLVGWKSPGWLTWAIAAMVGVLAILSFAQYLKAAYAPLAGHNPSIIFYTTMVSTVGTLVFSFLLQRRFVTDECRAAREAIRRLPAPKGPGGGRRHKSGH